MQPPRARLAPITPAFSHVARHQAATATAEEVSAALQLYFYPNGDGAEGRGWESWEQAAADVADVMRQHGFASVLTHKAKYWDTRQRTLLKKVVIKCPCFGKYRGQTVEEVKVDGGRRTTTSKCECPVHINIKVEKTGAICGGLCRCATRAWHWQAC
jgi:hypothetical protein